MKDSLLGLSQLLSDVEMLSLESLDPLLLLFDLSLPNPSEFLRPCQLVLIPGLLVPQSRVLLDELVEHALELLATCRTGGDLVTNCFDLRVTLCYPLLLIPNLRLYPLVIPVASSDNPLLVADLPPEVLDHLLVPLRFHTVTSLHREALVHALAECNLKFL